MKKLLFIPMLFACFMGMGQAAVSKSQSGGGKHFIGEKFGGGIVKGFALIVGIIITAFVQWIIENKPLKF